MKITIIGGGNMGGAIAKGLVESNYIPPQDITIINGSRKKEYDFGITSVVGDYSSLHQADIIILTVKPWQIKDLLAEHSDKLAKTEQILISAASGISLSELQEWSIANKALFRVMPNTAIAQRQSMNFICSLNADCHQKNMVAAMFKELGKVEFIDEKLFPAVTALSGCGIAYAFRYIRAAMEGGIEMGINSDLAKNTVLQTLRGAIELLEANDSHPEAEIDKVTTPGGITIKGLNEMEHAGFTSAVIRGLKASGK